MLGKFFYFNCNRIKMWGLILDSCPSCGHESGHSQGLLCKVCDNKGCKNCMTYLFSFFQYGIEPQVHENWYCHSRECYKVFAKEMEDNVTHEILDRDKFGIGLLRGVFHNAVKNQENQSWLLNKVSSSLSLDDFLFWNANMNLVSIIEKRGTELNNKLNGA